MNIRKIATIALLIATTVVTVTGILLFFGIGDHYLMVVAHDVFSITFISSVIVHSILNRHLIFVYFKAKKEVIINAVVAIIFIFIIAKSFSNQPELAFSDFPDVKNISLEAVLAADNVDYTEALVNLKNKGFIIPEGELTIQALTSANKINPKVIYGTMLMSKDNATQTNAETDVIN